MAGSQSTTIRVVAQDPSVRVNADNVRAAAGDAKAKILTGLVSFPSEEVEAGPIGHRVHVVDYDASTDTYYKAAPLPKAQTTRHLTNAQILRNPAFHAQNTYGLVMSTVARFESALGRRVAWGFKGHQLKIVPHAFAVANAYYDPDSESLLFGYFDNHGETIFTCLSHDVVVHETTHALLDGLRTRFLKPSSPDQAAFHEGFADIVALLSLFRMQDVVELLIDGASTGVGAPGEPAPQGLVRKDDLRFGRLVDSALFGLAEQLNDDSDPGRIGALRRSVAIEPDEGILTQAEFLEAHRRGEVLVAVTTRAFLDSWIKRLGALTRGEGDFVDRQRAAEEGANIADQLLTMMIRALDYTPPVHLRFGDFLSAVLTADTEVRPDDSKFDLRNTFKEWCGKYGIKPAPRAQPNGCWRPATDRSEDNRPIHLRHDGVRFSSVQSDPTEMFRLIWANRRKLKLPVNAYTWVSDVQPSTRMQPEDGLLVRETVATCIQHVKITAAELPKYGLTKPMGMDDEDEVELEGGSTLVLDEYGALKFEISNGLPRRSNDESCSRAQDRLNYLFETGALAEGASLRARLSNVHRLRADQRASGVGEVW